MNRGAGARILDSFGTDSLGTEGTANERYVVVHSATLAAISLIVLIKEKYADLVSDIRTDYIKLGHFGMVANKGAVTISMDIGGKKALFLNCHLEAHEENRDRRNS